ncbi:hypothetical protein I553_9300 [Mycobacterium xenopi 4042]|uniref:Uncharacterized protein n=1 Tax=Mycobacterium xenopi 4042 TaxID=1299334 RepID=X8DXJ8_MYCXE|nr:hypothetical protein I552_1371 [Mycobacterium xenopi 3993]EUA73144.1 hypothetical protein I553_9300 [Mycobacterium xenopi 4042]
MRRWLGSSTRTHYCGFIWPLRRGFGPNFGFGLLRGQP